MTISAAAAQPQADRQGSRTQQGQWQVDLRGFYLRGRPLRPSHRHQGVEADARGCAQERLRESLPTVLASRAPDGYHEEHIHGRFAPSAPTAIASANGTCASRRRRRRRPSRLRSRRSGRRTGSLKPDAGKTEVAAAPAEVDDDDDGEKVAVSMVSPIQGVIRCRNRDQKSAQQGGNPAIPSTFRSTFCASRGTDGSPPPRRIRLSTAAPAGFNAARPDQGRYRRGRRRRHHRPPAPSALCGDGSRQWPVDHRLPADAAGLAALVRS